MLTKKALNHAAMENMIRHEVVMNRNVHDERLTLFEVPLSAEPDRDTVGAMAISGGAPALASAAATVATGRATRFGVVTSRDDVEAPPSRLRVSSLVDSEENINMHENFMTTTCVGDATNLLDFRLA